MLQLPRLPIFWVPLLTDSLIDSLAVEGYVWCGLNKNKLQERKQQRLNKSLSWLTKVKQGNL